MESVEDYMKTMSWYKLNNLQLHLNDNGFLPSGRNKNDPEAWADVYAGFRIECETYPGLTNTDGSYTKDEFRSFMKESNAYGVTIIRCARPRAGLHEIPSGPGIDLTRFRPFGYQRSGAGL